MAAVDSNVHTVTTTPPGNKIGTTTIGATGGTTWAGAYAVLVVWVLTGLWGIDVPPEVVAALTVVIASIGTLIGGKLTPSNQVRTETQIVTAPAVVDQVVPPFPGTSEPFPSASGSSPVPRVD
ncbi:hypothetical protein [Kocuria rosea]|uniref:hypothetical protein n=1 Tax=Kocuria rosea TaxID=1275 RepID=UPI003D33F545